MEVVHPANHSSQPGATKSIILTDPVAFQFLEEDPSTKVVLRNKHLEGFECYVVEQWACSRTDPTFVITTYSGDPTHRILVNVLRIPIDETQWGPRLFIHFQALKTYNAKSRETPLGTIMVTNLSTFPSSLTVIPVPDGDVRAHRDDFFLSEDLKRLNCSGRVGLTLSPPSAATAAKFYQLYRASEKIKLNEAVIELVKMCQIALMLFDKLEPEFTDGLLCDMTERAINDWWIEFGADQYSIEPHDGILGPTTVSALLGLLIGARNRLNAYGAPIGKDVFDIESTKRAIAYFQKTHRMSKTRRLDRQTLKRLHRSTAKAASGDGWFVPRAVKSTMAELSGKSGEMVMDMVGGRDKSGIAEVETVDIEQFVHLVQGSKAKWLWQGKKKPQKSYSDERRRSESSKSTHGNVIRESSQEFAPLQLASSADSNVEALEERERERERNKLSKKPPDKSLGPKSQDSSRGLGKIKDAVGLRHHSSRHSKELDRAEVLKDITKTSSQSAGLSANSHAHVDGFRDGERIVASPQSMIPPEKDALFANILSETPTGDAAPGPLNPVYLAHVEPPSDGEEEDLSEFIPTQASAPLVENSPEPSINGSMYHRVDLDELFERNNSPNATIGHSFRRSQSYTNIEQAATCRNYAYWPRHLSFSMAEEGLSSWESAIQEFDHQEAGALTTSSDLEQARRIRQSLHRLETDLARWVRSEVTGVQKLESILSQNQDELNALIYSRSEEFRELLRGSKDVTEFEREQLAEAAKEVEVLGAKLEYEINILRGKVEDVEDGVDEFERQVIVVENRVSQLEKSTQPKEGWSHFLTRMMPGFGTPRNKDK
jgi:hypothetical protein